MVIGYWLWLWHKGGSSGGDSFCKGISSNSLRRSIVSACMCGEGVVIVRVLVMGVAMVVVVVMGKRKTTTITINTTSNTTNTDTKHSIK